MTADNRSPNYKLMQDFERLLQKENSILERLDKKQVIQLAIRFVRTNFLREKQHIVEAFKFGFDCAGKCDNPDVLANLYYAVKYNEQESELNKEAWYAEDKCNPT